MHKLPLPLARLSLTCVPQLTKSQLSGRGSHIIKPRGRKLINVLYGHREYVRPWASSAAPSNSGEGQKKPNPSSSQPLQQQNVQTLSRPPRKVSNFIFTKFLTFVQGYQDVLEKKFPQAIHVYRVFVIGFKVKNNKMMNNDSLPFGVLVIIVSCVIVNL